jgi:DNA polymerase-3 subunit delta'
MFEKIVGNNQVKVYLSKATQNNTLPHAMLFSGPSGLGKSLFAKDLAASLLQTTQDKIDGETHPDFHVLRPESKSGLHSIDSLRILIDEVHKAPFESHGKVFLIYDAERMQTASSNALLKTLEEPNPDTTLILLTEHLNEIIPTIRSRCALFKFNPIAEEEIRIFLKDKGYEEKWAKIGQGSIGKALELATIPNPEKLLFSLLKEKPIYPQLLLGLEKIEASIEDEDPVKKNRNAEYLFIAFLMWHRDQHVRRVYQNIDANSLFFPDLEAVSFPLPKMEVVSKCVEEALGCYKRNIKFSTCLESIFEICS